MASNVIIFGTGGGSELARRILSEDSEHTVVGCVVDDEYLPDSVLDGLDVVGLSDVAANYPPSEVKAFVPLGFGGMNDFRREKYLAMKALSYPFVTYVHSSNMLPPGTVIGENCMILQHQCINPEVEIGDNVIIWGGCHLGDRSAIGSHSWLSAHVCINGDVNIGANSFLGSNCTISHGLNVARRNFIGANALITKDTEEDAVHVVEGTPALGINSRRFMKAIVGA